MTIAEYFGLDYEALQEWLDWQREMRWDRETDEALAKEEQKESANIG
jgi:hypothetical protein